MLSLSAVAIAGFRIVRVPRVWDSPKGRVTEADSHGELTRLARTFKTALAAWVESISALATWVRYSPPFPGAKPAEPWFNDQSENDDGGPDILHLTARLVTAKVPRPNERRRCTARRWRHARAKKVEVL
jgi:hypothetical protein